MRGSLPSDTDAFEGVEWRNVLQLLRVIAESTLPLRQTVMRRYREQGTSLTKTLAFLRHTAMIRECGSGFSISEDCAQWSLDKDDRGVRASLFSHIMRRQTRFRKEILGYLQKFELVAGEVVYHPEGRCRAHRSAVRNFLIELGVVRYAKEGDLYSLAPDYIHIYAAIRQRSRRLSPSALARTIKARETLGEAVEKLVVSYEKERVGTALAHLVDHVSTRNVAAGYDIKSITLCPRGLPMPRYIEVKAVPQEGLTFYWTANEIAVAAALGKEYYLYLLPVTGHGRLEVDGLRTIPDAHAAVLGPNAGWHITKNVIRCSLLSQDMGSA